MRQIDNRDKIRIAAEQKTGEKKYWLEKLAGELKVTRLPYSNYDSNYDSKYYSNSNGSEAPVKGKQSLTRRLGTDAAEKLEKLSNQSSARLFMILVTGLNLLLYKFTGSSDIIIGTTIDRQGSREEYLNTVIPLRNRMDGNRTFKEHLLDTRKTVTEAFEHRNYPITLLTEQLEIDDIEEKNTLLDVMVLLENIHDESYIQGVRPQVLFLFKQTDTGINVTVKFGEKYTLEDMEHVLMHLEQTYTAALNAVDTKLKEIDILPESEKKRLKEEFNRTETPYPAGKTIHELFEAQVAQTPNEIAVVGTKLNNWKGSEEPLTYKELNQKANRIARMLREKGVCAGTVVGIMLPHSLDLIAAMMGILKAGGAYMPIGLEMPSKRVQTILNDSAATQLLVCHRTNGVPKTVHPMETIDIESADLSTISSENPGSEANAGNLAYIIYTSGSTGTPKGVMVEHESVVNVVEWYAVKNELTNGSRVILLSDYTFDASVNQIFGTLLNGGTLYVVKRELIGDAEKLAQYMEQNRIQLVNFVPVILRELLGNRDKIPSLRTVISGGERLTDDTKNILRQKGYRVHNQYGPTETTIDALADQCDENPISLGKPIANMQCYILDRDQNLTPVGVAGELYVTGIGVARGYLNNPELTHQKFQVIPTVGNDRLYRTGDQTRWRSDGKMDFLGRIDQQVKVRGYRIELGEIENHIGNFDGIDENVVIVKDDALCSYYTTSKKIEISDIRDYLTRQLPHYMIPTYFVPMQKLPLTSNGKLDRKALPDPKQMMGMHHNYVAPETPTQEDVARIWAEVLGIEESKIGIRDDFFELGGNSVNTLKIVFKVSETFNLNISVAEFFIKPTVEGLATVIDQKAMAQNLECVVKLNSARAERNLFIIHPGTGDIQTYVRLARLLEKKYNVYGIQPKGLMKESRLPRNPYEFLTDYLREIKKIQPEGPYLLGGYCVGSRLAYDMTGFLEDRDEKVEKLIIIDAMPFLKGLKIKWINFKYRLPLLRKMKLKRFGKTLDTEPVENENIRKIQEEELKERKEVVLENLKKVRKWMSPGKIVQTPTLVIKAQQNRAPRLKEKYWRKLIDADLKFVEIPGDHNSIFLTPYVNRMARVLKRKL
jgi:amino acid adenylation domain-containing protein